MGSEMCIRDRFHAFCVVVIRNAKYTALRDWSRKYKREISLEYLTEEKHHPLGTNDKCFQAPEPDEDMTSEDGNKEDEV